MDARTRKALEESIEKWRAIVAGDATDRGHSDCSLCEIFWDRCTVTCIGCPIFQKTGRPNCVGTPYSDYSSARYDGNAPKMVRAASQELEFLISLRPVEAA